MMSNPSIIFFHREQVCLAEETPSTFNWPIIFFNTSIGKTLLINGEHSSEFLALFDGILSIFDVNY